VSKNFWKTQIKRGHLIQTSGVGSIVRTQNGVTALVAGLRSWVETIPVDGSDIPALEKARKEYLKRFEIRDTELENACGVRRFISPPQQLDDGFGGFKPRNWEIPLVRFPLTEVCENFRCSIVKRSSPSDSKVLECSHCNQDKKFKFKTRQLPIFLACPKGHLHEIEWDDAIVHQGGCARGKIKIQLGEKMTSPKVTCVVCSGTLPKEPFEIPCNGGRPWLSGLPNESCNERMRLIERTSVSTYYASTKSAIHLPEDTRLNESLLDWLTNSHLVDVVVINNEDSVGNLHTKCEEAGFDIDRDSLIEHVSYIQSRRLQKSTEEAHWDIDKARTRELDVLTGRLTYPSLRQSKLIEFDVLDIKHFSHELVGENSLITHVSAVHRLTETRVLDGFSRITPQVPTQRDGYKLLWGHEIPKDSWLPGYRVHGEGILLELDSSLIKQKFGATAVKNGSSQDDPKSNQPSTGGMLAHSLAHLLISALADDCGYQLPSIRDRIYDLQDGRIGLLVYTAEGDTVGTMGGLVAFAQPGKLESLLDKSLENGRWCPQDPVCIERITDRNRHLFAACHQCLLLPETCCESFNSWLDRSLLVGGSAQAPQGVLY
jgi:hypothetical protein